MFNHDALPDIGIENVIGETTVVENHVTTTNEEGTFRKPFDVPPPPLPSSQKPMANNNENIGKPTREIVSCFMTTGGFISPAREGKLPEARKPIVIEEPPEPEEIPPKQRTPSPEIVDRKHHSKRENKNDNIDALKNYGANDGANTSHIDGSYEDVEHGKEVKLYEVIQTVPDALPKKKTKKSQLEIAQLKEQKKQKKLQQLKANRNAAKLGARPFVEHIIKGESIVSKSGMIEIQLVIMCLVCERSKSK